MFFNENNFVGYVSFTPILIHIDIYHDEIITEISETERYFSSSSKYFKLNIIQSNVKFSETFNNRRQIV